MQTTASEPRGSNAIESMCFAAQMHNIPVNQNELIRSLGINHSDSGKREVLLISRTLRIRAKAVKFSWAKLRNAFLPAIGQFSDGYFFVILKQYEDCIVVHDPRHPKQPVVLPKKDFLEQWTAEVILLRPEVAGVNTNARFGLSWFKGPLLRHKNVFFEILIAAFFVQLFGLATPLLTQVTFDKVVVHGNLSTLEVLGLGMIVIILFEAVLSAVQNYLSAHTGTRIDVFLGAKVFDHLLRLPLPYFEKRRVGDMVSHVREMDTIRQFLTGSSIGAILDVTYMFMFIVVMLFYSAKLTAVATVTLPVFAVMSFLWRPRLRKLSEERMDRAAAKHAFLVEAMTGVHTVKSLSLEPKMRAKWENLLVDNASASFRLTNNGAIYSASAQFLQRVTALAVLWYGAKLVIDGELTVGALIAFQMLASRVIQPIVRIAQVWQEFNNLSLSVDRLGDIMNCTPEQQIDGRGRHGRPTTGNICFDQVVFRYAPNRSPAVNQLSLSVTSGQTVAIVGRSGSGKSTFTKLIQRLYLPENGSISIDGQDLRLIDPTWLRSQIGVVLQENFLFNGSIAENIAIQFPHMAADEIIRVATLAGAHEFISELSDGYDTLVGERGTALSGGQRQRIAIARALISNPRILIFDEATSALDSESERVIQKNLTQICKGRTVFMIAHRLSTIRDADKILVMDRGTIVEHGDHFSLMARGGLYAKLFQEQTHLPNAA